MNAAIATVVEVQGKVSAIDVLGQKRELAAGDPLYMDEIVKTAIDSAIQLQVVDADSLKLEALQSLKLSADISPESMSDQTDAVLNVDLPPSLVDQLFSIYPLGMSSILADIEPVYDIERIKVTERQGSDQSLQLSDILQHSGGAGSLDQYLRFDQVDANTVIYLSNNGSFSDAASIESNADKVLTINYVGYTSSAELVSYLIDNYLVVDQV